MEDLSKFIADIEKKYFRTESDTGASENTLFIWNIVREHAGMGRLEKSDLSAFCVVCASYHVEPHKRK